MFEQFQSQQHPKRHRRPPLIGLFQGESWAKLCVTASTMASHGKVSAHRRIGWESGTNSAVCR